jgi:prevent-host-death family protein
MVGPLSLDDLANLANLIETMSKTVNMHEAKSTLSQLVSDVEAGEEVILARDGKPVARLVPIHAGRRRRLGRWKGKVRMSADFDAPLEADALAEWGLK